MIIGIGNDIVNIERIERLLNSKGERFVSRCFTKGEQNYANTKQAAGGHVVAAIYAKRYAAKEAFSKAVGTGIGAAIGLLDIEVVNNKAGKPEIKLSDKAMSYIKEQLTDGKSFSTHLSLSDDTPFAFASVIIES